MSCLTFAFSFVRTRKIPRMDRTPYRAIIIERRQRFSASLIHYKAAAPKAAVDSIAPQPTCTGRRPYPPHRPRCRPRYRYGCGLRGSASVSPPLPTHQVGTTSPLRVDTLPLVQRGLEEAPSPKVSIVVVIMISLCPRFLSTKKSRINTADISSKASPTTTSPITAPNERLLQAAIQGGTHRWLCEPKRRWLLYSKETGQCREEASREKGKRTQLF